VGFAIAGVTYLVFVIIDYSEEKKSVAILLLLSLFSRSVITCTIYCCNYFGFVLSLIDVEWMEQDNN